MMVQMMVQSTDRQTDRQTETDPVCVNVWCNITDERRRRWRHHRAVSKQRRRINHYSVNLQLTRHQHHTRLWPTYVQLA